MDVISEPVELGRFGSVFGVRGWIRIHSYTEDPESIFSYGPLFMRQGEDQWQPVKVLEWRRHGDGYVCRLEGFDQREESQSLTGRSVYVDESALPPLPEGEFYLNSLIGMHVVNTDGYDLGVVQDLMETGANDVLVVKANDNDAYGKKERLLPLVLDHTVLRVDSDRNVVEVVWDPDF